MVKDIIDSFKDNVSQKTSNPLLATILIIWTFKNWRLLYSLLYFDKDLKLQERISYIDDYYSVVNFYENLLYTILYSFIVLVGTYILLAMARVIVDTYNKVIVPKISKWTDKTSVVLKSDYITLFRQNEELEKKLSLEREARIKAKNELEGIEARLADLMLEKESIKQLQSENKNLLTKNKELTNQIESIENGKNYNSDIGIKYEKLRSEHDNLLKDYNNSLISTEAYNELMKQNEQALSDREDTVISKITNDEELTSSFLKLCEKVLNNDGIDKNNAPIRYFVSLGLFEIAEHYTGNLYHYKLTNLGRKVYNLAFNNIL